MLNVFTSKTLALWIVIFLIALLAIVISAGIGIAFGYNVPYVDKFFSLLEWGGTGGTARNVISDGIMPRIPQAVGAVKDPGVAVESPVSMALATDRADASAAVSGASYVPAISMGNVIPHREIGA